jgi:hypothetical protein
MRRIDEAGAEHQTNVTAGGAAIIWMIAQPFA